MAITNSERVGQSLDLLRQGLQPFAERELKSKFGDKWPVEVKKMLADRKLGAKDDPLGDVAVLLLVMDKFWGAVFGNILPRSDRTIALELVDVRNQWAHLKSFSGDDTYRALDSAGRLLTAVSAPQADEVTRLKTELLRTQFEERSRSERRKATRELIESPAGSTLKPWREVVDPHPDVRSGKYQQAEFAADLWQVHIGEGSAEYCDPVEFFRRTYLTESLHGLLVDAILRLNGGGGDPVVQLQTNFGGGKTHSMLALYHLVSGTKPAALAGVAELLAESGQAALPRAKRVVLVGNKISPGNPVTKPDGTVVRTLWGELAWQLGGKKAYARVAKDDERATNPGDVLRELMVEHGPALILIDEWVAYARQLHDQGDLPAGSFETQFTFAQALTESAKLAENCLLVVSLPASDTAASPHTVVDDVEVGGVRGREALHRLGNVIGRVESSWRPATAEEGFEIVRRRLFAPMNDPAQFTQRDVTARAFADLYRQQRGQVPAECADAGYEARIKAAYPIHPEIFDRLYSDWSTLIKFQRTRGVLRLMAAVIHSLWESGDRHPLILPASIPIGDRAVQSELTRYLPDQWTPIIETDVDGPNALPPRLDAENANLGRYSATRRVARTIYLGSAPTVGAAHVGIEDRRITLGCLMPGELPPVFGDALRRLAAAATYLYQDGPRYWYSTQPTVTKRADDLAEQLKRDPDKVMQEIDARVRSNLKRQGDFARVHALPQSGQDVPDDQDARLVVLSIEHAYSKGAQSGAETTAKAILATRGNTPRLYQNALVFLVADESRKQELEDAARKYLAWSSIVDDKVVLDLGPQQVKQAESRKASAERDVDLRLPETYQWLLVPTQLKPQDAVSWQATRLNGQEELAVRASKKLRSEELLLTSLGATRLRMELDRVPLWRGDSVSIRQLADDFARYLYLPRLRDPSVLVKTVSDGVALFTWERETFAIADTHDVAAGRFLGLRHGQQILLNDAQSEAVLVKPEAARRQIDSEPATPNATAGADAPRDGDIGATPAGEQFDLSDQGRGAPLPKRFHGSVSLNAERVGRDAGQIASEVIAHLVGLVGADVRVMLEIDASIPSGAPEHVVRTVTENSRTLKFGSAGFEGE